MEAIFRPKIKEDYFKLNPRQATVVAIRAAKDCGTPGKPDMSIFRYMTREYNMRYRGKQLSMLH